MKKIGIIGLGNMGSAVASNILRANYQIFVFDIRKEAADKLVKKGAKWKNSPKELINDSDIVVSMVFGPKEINEVMVKVEYAREIELILFNPILNKKKLEP